MNENVWQIKEIRRQFTKFVNQLNPRTARSTAYDYGMLELAKREELLKDEELGRNHNEHLLGILERRGFEGFGCLLEILKVQNRGTWANELRVLASLPEEAAPVGYSHNNARLTALPSHPSTAHSSVSESLVDVFSQPSSMDATSLSTSTQPVLQEEGHLDDDEKGRTELHRFRQRCAALCTQRQADGNSALTLQPVGWSGGTVKMPGLFHNLFARPTTVHQVQTQQQLKRQHHQQQQRPQQQQQQQRLQQQQQQQQQQDFGQQQTSSSDSTNAQSASGANLQQTTATTVDNDPEECAGNDQYRNELIQGMETAEHLVMIVNSDPELTDHMYPITKGVFFRAFVASAGESIELSQDSSGSACYHLQMSPRSVYRLTTIAKVQPGFLAGIGMLDFREEHSNVGFSLREDPSQTTNTWIAGERLDANAIADRLLADGIVTEDDVTVAKNGSSWNYFVKHVTMISLLHRNGPRRVLEQLACLSRELLEILEETATQPNDDSSHLGMNEIRDCSSYQVNALTTESSAYTTCLPSSTTAAVSTMTSSESNSMVYTSVPMSTPPSSKPAEMMQLTPGGIVPQQHSMMSPPAMMSPPVMMPCPPGMKKKTARMSQPPGMISQSATLPQRRGMITDSQQDIIQIFPANTAQQQPFYLGNPPARNTSGQLAARGRTDQSWSWLSDNQRHMRHLLIDRYRQARMDVDEDMLEEGLQATVENLSVEIVVLPRSGLREEFKDQSFDSSGDMWRVEHVFTRAGQNLKNVTLESLFEDIPETVRRGTTFRVVAISSAGCGKTTVFTKVAPFRWASGDLWSNLFDMVFAREFRYEEVRGAKCAQDLLDLSRFNLTEEQRQHVLQYVKHHPERVCLVLDGLDETSLSSCSNFVHDVIRGHELQGIRLVLTSRPSGDIFKLTDSQRLDRKVELVGFRPEDVRLFVGKFLNATEATELLKEIANNPHLLSMMSTPVLAYEICKLYHWRMQVPRCVADIFELMILRLAERRSEFQYSTWNDVPESVRTAILSLGSFSFRKLQDQQLVFTETELQSCSILRDAIFHGLLVACDHNPADVSVKQWRFSHLTLQENLAAKFVACSGTMSSGKIVRLVECLDPDAGHMRTFWMLLAAQLNSACLETLVNSLMLCEKEEGAHLPKMSVADVSKLNFPQTYHGILYECLSRSSMNRLAELLLGAVSSGSATKLVESKMSRVHSSPDGDFLETLLLTWVNEFPAANESMLVEALKHIDEGAAQLCREVKEQTLESSCAPHSLSFPKHASFLDNKPLGVRRQLAFQCFAEYALYHDDAVQPVPSIAESLKHKKSKITTCGDSNPWLCRTVDTVVKHHQHAVRRVRLERFSDSSACNIPSSLSQCSKLEELSLSKCPSQWNIVHDIIHSSSSTLKRLSFQYTHLSTDDMKYLAPAISACSQLKDLHISNHHLSLDTFTVLTTVLPALSALEIVHLKASMDGSVGDAAVPLLCSALCKCVKVHKLEFSSCSLSACSLAVIAASLHHWPALNELHLDRNDFGDVSEEQTKQFIDAVNAHDGLRKVELSYGSFPKDHPLLSKESYRTGVNIHIDGTDMYMHGVVVKVI